MLDQPPTSPWTHDRWHVRFLHEAHADHIESLYQALKALPGNPEGVTIEQVGTVRTLLARGNRWENRAIFHGNETREQIDEVLRHFASHQANCVIEINIANSYVEPPNNWEARLLPHLIAKGCQVGGMRCVWYREQLPSGDETDVGKRIVRFAPDQIRDYARFTALADPKERWTPDRYAVEGRPDFYHYVGFDGEHPCAFGSLFLKGEIGYLAYWETRNEYRGRGFQQAGIRQRVIDAFNLGCNFTFTVSDYNFASPRNLQRCGFQLAYNYLVVTRDPSPLP